MKPALNFILSICLIYMSFGCKDDDSPVKPENQGPIIVGISSGVQEIRPDAYTTLFCYATDAENYRLNYQWRASEGTFPEGSTGSAVRWLSPTVEGSYTITVRVDDYKHSVEDSIEIPVSENGRTGEWDFEIGDTGVMVTMIWIESGSYEMGSLDSAQATEADVPFDTTAETDEFPQHTVTIGYGFWTGKYEVTQAQWEAVTDTCPSNFRGRNKPVENVSWMDVKAFIDSLNGMEESLNNGHTEQPWRLLSESEWEYVCRAGTEMRFPWGDDTGYVELDKWTWSGFYNGLNGPIEVGSRLPNPWGIHDMLGNVWEWCEDWYKKTYEGAPDDGSPRTGRTPYRVLRGGSWYDIPQHCRSASRHVANKEIMRYRTVGFRLARDGPIVYDAD